MAEKSYPDAYPIVDLADNPASGFVFPWRSPNGWVEKKSDGTVQPIAPTTFGQTLDFSAIKKTSSGVWAGATLSDGPQNSGSEGMGAWRYKGDDKNGTLSIAVWFAVENKQIEGCWERTRTNGTWGVWALCPTKDTFQVTTGATTAITGQNWAIAAGHVVTLSYVDQNKPIRLKPAGNLTWDKVTQYVSTFTVPAKPANGSSVVELKINTNTATWETSVTVDPLDTRMVAVEAKAAANETDISSITTRTTALETTNSNLSILHRMTPSAGVGTNMLCSLEGDTVFVATATGTTPRAANCFVSAHSAATTPFYGRNYLISASWIPTGATKGSLLYLGNNGAISLSPPAMSAGNVIQQIGRVNGSGQGILDIKEAIWVGA